MPIVWGNEGVLASSERPSVAVVHESPAAGPALFELNLDTGRLIERTDPHVRIENARTRRISCQAADGVELWADVVSADDLHADPRPALVYSYGYLNTMVLPWWLPIVPAFVDAGGRFVFAHIRGSGEYGEASYRHAIMHRQATTFDDLYTICDHLVASGLVPRDGLALAGASAGGLLAAVALTQRPDLFRVVVSLAPLTDLVRVAEWIGDTDEFGRLETAHEAAHVRKLSPIHNVRLGTAYPAVLLGCGESDTNCPPWHARKLAAALQAATSSHQPVLLRVWDADHRVTGGVSGLGEEGAECLAFILDCLGMGAPREVSTTR